jgi:glucan-binding YG repeat protein
MTNCDMPCGRYSFDAEGKMIGSSATGEVALKNGVLYYFERGTGVEKGLIEVDGDYYFTAARGRVIQNEIKYVYLTNCDLPCGRYEFGPDGKMVGSRKDGEIVVKDGTMYYYESGAAVEKGLICLDGDYYFTAARGRIIVNKVQYASLTSCDLPCGRYEFDADGKMIGSSATGELINKDGVDYYYEKGQKVNKGLVKLDGEFYYIITGGKVVKNKTHYVSVTNDYLPAGNYDFDADGKMIGSSSTGEIVNRNGVLYYYENGVRVAKGLVYIDNHYYFASTNGRLAVNCTTNVWEANGLLIEGYYTFNELGQLVG